MRREVTRRSSQRQGRPGGTGIPVHWDVQRATGPCETGLSCPARCRGKQRKGRALKTFTAGGAASLTGPDWLRRRRVEAFEAFEVTPLPSEKEEVWRYSPVDSLDLDAFSPAGVGPGNGGSVPRSDDSLVNAFVSGVARDLAGSSALVLVRNGRPVSVERTGLPPAVTVAGSSEVGVGTGAGLGDVLVGGDALVRLNDAFLPDALVIDVPSGVELDGPIVVVHWCDGAAGAGAPAPACFPRTLVRVGARARAGVVEVMAGAPGDQRALVVPVSEMTVADGGQLSHVSLQVLGTGAWHVGRICARVERDATLRTFGVGLGGAYDRLRTDAGAAGSGAHCELRSAYLGVGDQVHDIRTLQDHRAPRTTSDLLCKGAVAGSSRSVYSGLIRVRHGAVRTEALQTNHNLVLDERAHADSVPNLDIEENDVRCSHASTVGPVDEDQRYYLESRGVPPERAERLIVLGFFSDIVGRSPVPEVLDRLRQEVGLRLADALAVAGGRDGGTGTGGDGGRTRG